METGLLYEHLWEHPQELLAPELPGVIRWILRPYARMAIADFAERRERVVAELRRLAPCTLDPADSSRPADNQRPHKWNLTASAGWENTEWAAGLTRRVFHRRLDHELTILILRLRRGADLPDPFPSAVCAGESWQYRRSGDGELRVEFSRRIPRGDQGQVVGTATPLREPPAGRPMIRPNRRTAATAAGLLALGLTGLWLQQLNVYSTERLRLDTCRDEEKNTLAKIHAVERRQELFREEVVRLEYEIGHLRSILPESLEPDSYGKRLAEAAARFGVVIQENQFRQDTSAVPHQGELSVLLFGPEDAIDRFLAEVPTLKPFSSWKGG